ncbi:MAG TPA: cytochrome c biogenesis protein CcsA [Polyangiaceae bacterium]|jgi:ABC-type uncharacterized transport system permease subunit|nr:cytochrome c biogenesis protein CcsA [Polyangiaceae bacterium]
MSDLATITFYLGLVAYSAAATLFFAHLARREQSTLTTWAPHLLAAAVTLHLGHVLLTSVLTHTCPVESLQFALSLSAVMVTASYLMLRRRLSIDALGVAVAPLGLTFMVAAQFVSGSGAGVGLPRALLAMHITANVIGFGLFLLAGFAGSFYLILERRLKAKRVAALHARLPALDALDRAEHRLLLAGFPLLTFGAVTGAMFVHELGQMSGAAWVRAVLAYATWALVAMVLILRRVAGWRGRRSAYGTLAGVLCVLVVVLIYILQAGVGV